MPTLLTDFSNFWTNYSFLVFGVVGLIFVGSLIYVIYKFIIFYLKIFEKRIRRRVLVEQMREKTQKLFEIKIDDLNYDDLITTRDFFIGSKLNIEKFDELSSEVFKIEVLIDKINERLPIKKEKRRD